MYWLFNNHEFPQKSQLKSLRSMIEANTDIDKNVIHRVVVGREYGNMHMEYYVINGMLLNLKVNSIVL